MFDLKAKALTMKIKELLGTCLGNEKSFEMVYNDVNGRQNLTSPRIKLFLLRYYLFYCEKITLLFKMNVDICFDKSHSHFQLSPK